MKSRIHLVVTLWLLTAVCLSPAHGEEGYWLFTEPPSQLIAQRYDFDPGKAWLARLQGSAVRLSSGGSAAFVSPEGLVVTTHTAVHGYLGASPELRESLEEGFVAASQAQEIPLEGLQVLQLKKTVEVTQQVRAEVDLKAREKIVAQIAAENSGEGTWAQVVPLFHGARYHLYVYKVYSDVRLVFVPEATLAFFGGDEDNFEYPRYTLDVAFLRAYENGNPAQPGDYLPWAQAGVKEGELVFTAANPGHSTRLITLEHLAFLRDVQYPLTLDYIRRVELVLGNYLEENPELVAELGESLNSLQSARKVYESSLERLRDPSLIRKRKEISGKVRRAVGDETNWQKVATLAGEAPDLYRRYYLFQAGRGFNSPLFGHARALVRLHQSPESDPQVEEVLLSEGGISPELEAAQLEDSLAFMVEVVGFEDALVQAVLDGKSPRERAFELVSKTGLRDPAFRKQLLDAGREALKASTDPMVQLALMVEPEAASLTTKLEGEMAQRLDQAYRDLADQVLNSEAGKMFLYPDASNSPRFSYGTVQGYLGLTGEEVPAFTTLRGLLKRSANKGGTGSFRLPSAWKAAEFAEATPLNFVCTLDVTEGNAGGAVVNRRGQVVGVVFDGNGDSLGQDVLYTEERARAIAVDSRAVLETLHQVYRAEALAKELEKG